MSTQARLGTRSTLERIPAGGGVPEQFLVIEDRAEVPNRNDQRLRGIRVAILERSFGVWETVYEREFLRGWLDAQLGDVTGDGHKDVLFVSEQGSAGCGEHLVIASVRRKAREILRRATCETHFRLADGRLLIDEPVGPCPLAEDALHCFGGRREIVMRWSGTRLVRESAVVKCSGPDLDPANDCRKR